jgi:hypothetical protein
MRCDSMAHPDSPEANEIAVEDESTMEATSSKGIRWKMALTAGVMAVIVGGLAAWATLNLGIAAIAFLVGAAGSGYYLYQKTLPSEAIGSGLWISALLMLVLPISFYLPIILGTDGAESAEAAGTFIGSIAGLFIWGFVFFILAIVVAAIGYFFKRRAKRKLG